MNGWLGDLVHLAWTMPWLGGRHVREDSLASLDLVCLDCDATTTSCCGLSGAEGAIWVRWDVEKRQVCLVVLNFKRSMDVSLPQVMVTHMVLRAALLLLLIRFDQGRG